MKVVPRILGCQNNNIMQVIDNQWRCLSFLVSLLPKDVGKPDICTDKFWNQILDYNNAVGKSEFHKLATFALDILSLPHSNADCERIFSQINMMKTKYRNKLKIETVNGLLLAAEYVKQSGEENCITFQPTNEMLQKMTSIVLYPRKKKQEEAINEDSETEIFF
ncbi:uncharacterized protein LOC116852447 [Odontomachus brunneus]|uniref:uncharacterized protein LOC116852447 n=1 Tax=Odontomachus brunneus TaxID=486640 RepID=UPI0013F29EF8|nr:uncharacterized protein LOC116852447 [Odontomachus brunneus]